MNNILSYENFLLEKYEIVITVSDSTMENFPKILGHFEKLSKDGAGRDVFIGDDYIIKDKYQEHDDVMKGYFDGDGQDKIYSIEYKKKV